MKNVISVLTTILLVSCISSATATDIVGYVFYQDYYNHPYLNSCAAFPVTNAEVTLYKRTASSGWLEYGTTVNTNSEGFYVFEDINVGSGIGGLCTYSEWFRVNADASEFFPEVWPWDDVVDRFSHNEIRPSGIPDDGSIRVDFVLEGSSYVPYLGQSEPTYLEGHFVVEDNLGVFYSPYVCCHIHSATCPLRRNRIEGGGCNVGHWINTSCFSNWFNVDAYSEFVFSVDLHNQSNWQEVAWCYVYWTHPWPSWVCHIINNVKVCIVRDFVYHQPDEIDHPPVLINLSVNSGVECLGTVHSLPNPSAQRTELHYSLSEACDVELSLFDLSGRLVSILVEGLHEAGEYTVLSGDLRSGIYLCRLEAGSSISTTRILIE